MKTKLPNPDDLVNALYDEDLPFIQDWVEKGYSLDVTATDGDTPLHMVARTGNLPLLKYLIDKGEDIHRCNEFEVSVLSHACYSENREMVKYLIDEGADVFARDSSGEPVFFAACFCDKPKIPALFLEKGVNINEVHQEDGFHALSLNAGDVDCNPVSFWLIEQGIDIHHADKMGQTALYEAYIGNNVVLMQHLLERGASFEIFSPSGRNWFEEPLPATARTQDTQILYDAYKEKRTLHKNLPSSLTQTKGIRL